MLDQETQNKEVIVKEKKKTVKVVLIVLGILIGLFLIAGIAGYAYVRYTLNKVNTVTIDKSKLDAIVSEKQSAINIAMFGIDGNSTNSGRSDAIMIFTIDPKQKKCRLCSVMRDSYVNIEGHGMDKINHAYAYGGPELSIRTLNQNFGLDISHFVAVDFETLPEIIDMIGGINLEITDEEANTGSISGITSAGTYTLTGKQALGYSRIRYATGNDFQRTQRQRNVINAMVKKVSESSLTEWPAIAAKVLPLITTDYSGDDIMDLVTKYGSYVKHGMLETRFPVDGTHHGEMIDGVYYLTFDIQQQAELIKDFVYNGVSPQV